MVSLRIWANGGIDPSDAAQRQPLAPLIGADMDHHGAILANLHDNALYILRMLREGRHRPVTSLVTTQYDT